jgi:hypothetical protein
LVKESCFLKASEAFTRYRRHLRAPWDLKNNFIREPLYKTLIKSEMHYAFDSDL